MGGRFSFFSLVKRLRKSIGCGGWRLTPQNFVWFLFENPSIVSLSISYRTNTSHNEKNQYIVR